jgi:UDP-N-acetylmuramoyl-L-alanyl-D-glutamate--2,6-diaminopimelate ligase
VNIKKAFFREAEQNVTLITSQIDEATISLRNELVDRNIITFSTKYISGVYKLNDNNIDYVLTANDKIFDSLEGLNMTVKTKEEQYRITSNLIMPYNALNITCCVAVLDTLKVFNKDQFQVLIKDIVIPGRDEVIKASNRTIIISVNLVPHLENLKRYQSRGEINKIIVVSGATGIDFVSWDKEFEENKYFEEKEKSIKFAYNYIKNNCDLVYITTSDSGTANKEGLLGYQANMVKDSIPYITEVNRKTAIKKAIESSEENDVIFISGRGNRRVMCDTKDMMTLHLDKEVVIDILEELNWR